jgi:peroxiredoxin
MSAGSLIEELDACTRRCKDMDAPLADRLSELAADVRRLAPSFADIVDRMVDRLAMSGAGSTAPAIGEPMPPFVLPDENGRLTSLSQFLEAGSVVIAFHRGHWCPYCRIEARALAQIEPEVGANDGRIVIITPETQEYTRKLKADSGGQFSILTDMDGGYALDLDLAIKINDEKRNAMTAAGWDIAPFQNNDNWILPIPATFVLDQTGIVRGRFVDPDYRKRMDIEDMLDALRQAREPLTPAA